MSLVDCIYSLSFDIRPSCIRSLRIIWPSVPEEWSTQHVSLGCPWPNLFYSPAYFPVLLPKSSSLRQPTLPQSCLRTTQGHLLHISRTIYVKRHQVSIHGADMYICPATLTLLTTPVSSSGTSVSPSRQNMIIHRVVTNSSQNQGTTPDLHQRPFIYPEDRALPSWTAPAASPAQLTKTPTVPR